MHPSPERVAIDVEWVVVFGEFILDLGDAAGVLLLRYQEMINIIYFGSAKWAQRVMQEWEKGPTDCIRAAGRVYQLGERGKQNCRVLA